MLADGRNLPPGSSATRHDRADHGVLWRYLPYALGLALLGLAPLILPWQAGGWVQQVLRLAGLAAIGLAVIAVGQFCGRREVGERAQESESELQRVQAALRRSEERFDAILNQSAVGVAVADMEGRILIANSRLCEILGYTYEQLRYRSYREITDPEDLPADDAQAQRLIRGEIDSYSMEKRFLRSDGSSVWTDLTCSAVRGDIDYVLAIVHDISQRRRAQDAMRESEAKFRVLAENAESANAAKDHFLAVLSHELRTPLTPVLVTASALRHGPIESAETRENLTMICRNVELEARLIDDLLDLTRLSRGKLELRPQPVQAAVVLRHTVEICANEIAGKGLQLHVSIDEGDGWLRADPPRLQQVFWNLLNNAIKFTPTGGRIDIRMFVAPDGAECPSDAGCVVVEISDTGVGIAPDALPRIFGAFEQGSRSVTRKFGGLGLGLAISKAVVEMHGGTISAHSEGLGKGAMFRVVLPTIAPPVVQEAETPAPAAKEEERRARILLVEDHTDTAKVMSRLLQASGHTVRVADSVASGLEAAAKEQFDLTISDLGLPDGSGLELMRRLRQEHPEIRGIALSGYGMEEDLTRSRESGFAEHLTKPVSFDRLKATIARVLGKDSDGASAPL